MFSDNQIKAFVRLDDDFIAQAACRGLPTEWWFPELGMNVLRTPTLKKAKEICSSCEVKQLCYEYGVATDSWGIWGGVTLNNGYPTAREKGRVSSDS